MRRETAEKRFSVQVNAPKYLDIIKNKLSIPLYDAGFKLLRTTSDFNPIPAPPIAIFLLEPFGLISPIPNIEYGELVKF